MRYNVITYHAFFIINYCKETQDPDTKSVNKKPSTVGTNFFDLRDAKRTTFGEVI